MRASEHKDTFDKLSDAERWKFLRTLKKHDYMVFIDSDCTYVMFSDDEEDIIGDFDFCVGRNYGVKHLLTLLHIHFEEV